jgi:hypothetical protein
MMPNDYRIEVQVWNGHTVTADRVTIWNDTGRTLRYTVQIVDGYAHIKVQEMTYDADRRDVDSVK